MSDNDVPIKRVFTQQGSQEDVQLVFASGKSTSEVARDLGIASSTLKTWVANAKASADGTELDLDERGELKRLRADIKVLRMGRYQTGEASSWWWYFAATQGSMSLA